MKNERDVTKSGNFVRRRELSSEGRRRAEEWGEMVGEEPKVAARKEEFSQEEWESQMAKHGEKLRNR